MKLRAIKKKHENNSKARRQALDCRQEVKLKYNIFSKFLNDLWTIRKRVSKTLYPNLKINRKTRSHIFLLSVGKQF